MKLAVVIEQLHIASGGTALSTQQILSRLIQRGHEITLITSSTSGVRETLPGLNILHISGLPTTSALGLLSFSRLAQQQLDQGDYDASLSMTLTVPATVIQPRSGTAREMLSRSAARQPTTLQRSLREAKIAITPRNWASLWLESRTLNHPRVKRLATLSYYVTEQLFHHYAIPSRRITLIPNAASIEPMSPQHRAELRHNLRNQLRLADDHIVFLFAATDIHTKGLAPLLAAMRNLRRDHPQARLIVAGAPVELVPDDESLRRVGRTHRMDALYAAADVSVLPTFYDPSSRFILESLLYAVPAVSTIFNGASQWIADPARGDIQITRWTHGRTSLWKEGVQPAGRVIRDPHDTDELAGAMRALCDPAEHQRCALAAQNLDLRLNMDTHVDQLEQLLTQLAG